MAPKTRNAVRKVSKSTLASGEKVRQGSVQHVPAQTPPPPAVPPPEDVPQAEDAHADSGEYSNTESDQFLVSSSSESLPAEGEESDHEVQRGPLDSERRDLKNMTSDDYAILRHRRQYVLQKNTANPRFHTQFQEQVYEEIYMHNKFANHKYVDWDHIDGMDIFTGTWRLFQAAGIHHLVTLKSDYNEDIIRQFYATLWISNNFEHLEWMTGSQYMGANKAEFEAALNTFSGIHEKVFDRPAIPLHQCSEFYDTTQRFVPGKLPGLLPIPSLINRILNHTVVPKSGNYDSIRGHVWNIIKYIMTGKKFDVIDVILREMADSKNDRTRNINYAPYIMALIIHKNGPFRGGKGGVHKPYKPREKAPLPTRPSAPSGASTSSQPQTEPGQEEITLAQLQSSILSLNDNVTKLSTLVTEQFSSLSSSVAALGDRLTALETSVAPVHYERRTRRRRDTSPSGASQDTQQ